MTDTTNLINQRAEKVQRHYQEYPPHPTADNTASGVVALPITRVLLEWAGTGRRVLDLGCHQGDITALIRDAGNEVVGVDLPAIAEEACRRHGFEAVGHNLNDPLPFADAGFDIVLASSVLDDIPDDLTFLKECRRVLVDGGRLIVVVPNEASLFCRINLLLGRSCRDFTSRTGYHTLHRYPLEGIRTLLQVAGFDVEAYRKCPKRFSKIPFRYWMEKMLPATFATDLAVCARKPVSAMEGNAP